MPKGAKKRAKLKKQQQQQGHPDDAGNTRASNGNGNGNASDDNNNNNSSSGRDGDGDLHHHHLRIPPKVSRVDASEDSMESSEEMVTPRAAASEPDEEERKATAAEVPVEHAVEADVAGSGEVMVDAFAPETAAAGQEPEGKVDEAAVEVHAVVAQEPEGKVDEAEVEVHALVAQEPEVKDVLVAEESVVQEPVADAPAVEALVAEESVVQEPVPDAPAVEASSEVKKEVAKVHPVLESEPEVDDVVVVEETPVVPEVKEPEVKGAGATVVLKEPETDSGDVVVKDSAEVSQSQEAVEVHTTEMAREPVVAVAASRQRATWWNCCGVFDAFTGSGR